MNKYIKLVNFEINRFIKVYAALLGITIIFQLLGVVIESNSYLKRAKNTMFENSMTKTEYIEEFGAFDMSQILNTFWFLVPIAICAAALIFYIFLIWYRDWFGKNTFIYRLLMLPTSRLNIYLAKATAIFLMVFGLVALQLILLPIENALFQMLVPADFKNVMNIETIIRGNSLLMIVIPNSFIQFLLYYGLGFTAVFTLFTAILFERSYRIKGIAMGIIYCLAALAVFLLPIILNDIYMYLYLKELLALEIILGILVMSGSIWFGNFLLKNKVTV